MRDRQAKRRTPTDSHIGRPKRAVRAPLGDGFWLPDEANGKEET
jgi:hypothetical protein